MNSGRKVGFGWAPGWRRRATLFASMVSVAASTLCGCESTEAQTGVMPSEMGQRNLVELSTAELKTRHREVLKRYGEIQQDVELKAGLPMGVAIKDERALLGDLYREAHEIERELLRRFSRGDPEVTIEQLRAGF